MKNEIKVRDQNKLRWDKWYFDICEKVSENSKCLSRKIGSILVRDKAIFSQGYNGPPRGIRTCDTRWEVDNNLVNAFVEKFGVKPTESIIKDRCPRYVLGFKSGQGLEWCVAGHGERNSLINAAREGFAVKGAIMYMNCGIPCGPCMVEIINAGISEIICTKDAKFIYDASSLYLLKESKIKFRVYSHICKHENVIGLYCKDCDSHLEGDF
jgi:dCMP deaminase